MGGCEPLPKHHRQPAHNGPKITPEAPDGLSRGIWPPWSTSSPQERRQRARRPPRSHSHSQVCKLSHVDRAEGPRGHGPRAPATARIAPEARLADYCASGRVVCSESASRGSRSRGGVYFHYRQCDSDADAGPITVRQRTTAMPGTSFFPRWRVGPFRTHRVSPRTCSRVVIAPRVPVTPARVNGQPLTEFRSPHIDDFLLLVMAACPFAPTRNNCGSSATAVR